MVMLTAFRGTNGDDWMGKLQGMKWVPLTLRTLLYLLTLLNQLMLLTLLSALGAVVEAESVSGVRVGSRRS
jgi:hypothetical protein